MNANQNFTNPYNTPEITPTEKRIHTEVSREDYLLVKLIRPDQGTVKKVLGHLWKQLCYELRQRAITDHTSSTEFESFIVNCRIVPGDEYERLCNGAVDSAPRPMSETDGGHDRAGATFIPTNSPNEPSKRPDVPRKSRGKGRKQPGEAGK